jgi:hypothetical protein
LKRKKDMSDLFKRVGLELTRVQGEHKREEGLEATHRGLTAHVWTSWIAEDQAIRDHDYGWVLITEGDTIRYVAKWFMRSEHFLDHLFAYARIALEKIRNRPLCPSCGRFMYIRSGIGAPTYWVCRQHRPWETMDWDCGISEEDKAFLQIRRKETREYNKKREKAGKPKRGTTLRRRSGMWKTNQPQNKI